MADADPVWQFQERERRLVKEIVDFLDSKEWNPNKGSVPSERVQNCIKGKYPGLYRSVVGAYYRCGGGGCVVGVHGLAHMREFDFSVFLL